MSEQRSPFDNLVKIGQLKQENFIEQEFIGLTTSAMRKLRDAKNTSLSIDSRFDLAYNAAHALSLKSKPRYLRLLSTQLRNCKCNYTELVDDHALPTRRQTAQRYLFSVRHSANHK